MGNRFPLEGIRIADFSWVMAGPVATKYFADHGAEVIRLESGQRLEQLRMFPVPPVDSPSPNVSGAYNNHNTSKMSATIDLGHPKARELVYRLVSVSDIVIENFNPGVMERLGFSYEKLRRVRPDLVFLSMPGFGSKGPKSYYRAWGSGIQATAGINYITGWPDRPPTGILMAYADVTSNPFHALIAMLSALVHRQRTGQGQYIELSQYESTICLLDTTILDYTVNGKVRVRNANRHPYAAPHGVYRCLGHDRWVAVAVFTDGEWEALRCAMGDQEWAREERFATLAGRLKHMEELDRRVEEWTSQHTAEEVMHDLQRAGVAAGVVQTTEDMVVRDPQFAARNRFVRVDHPEMEKPLLVEGTTFKLSRTPGCIRRRAPLLGEHNDYVFQQVLGLTEDEVNEYMVEGAIA